MAELVEACLVLFRVPATYGSCAAPLPCFWGWALRNTASSQPQSPASPLTPHYLTVHYTTLHPTYRARPTFANVLPSPFTLFRAAQLSAPFSASSLPHRAPPCSTCPCPVSLAPVLCCAALPFAALCCCTLPPRPPTLRGWPSGRACQSHLTSTRSSFFPSLIPPLEPISAHNGRPKCTPAGPICAAGCVQWACSSHSGEAGRRWWSRRRCWC